MMKIEPSLNVVTTPERHPSPKLERAAHEFEACFIQELLKPMREQADLSGSDQDSDSGSGSEDALRSFGMESIARSISERGGLGIARLVLQKLSPLEHSD